MLIPVAIVIIVVFVVWALFLIFRKAGKNTEVKNNQEISGNEKKIIKPGSETIEK